ncbi:MAG: DUF2238 domain-containing protein [Duncaniella sp.]|nr:DUF2238 domain-containing protein [Duncaniella sp.]
MSQLKVGFFPPYQPTAVVVALIVFLTLVPKPVSDDIPMFEGADKVVHFIMFGALTGVVCFDRWRTGRPLGMRGALVVALCSALAGVGIEWLQGIMGLGRGGNDPWDALADMLGAFAAVPVCRALHWIDVLVDDRAG